ncbi:Uncharacterised protein [Bordetella trematum]|nr:Uncharacterised protein [Bordetella trematum]
MAPDAQRVGASGATIERHRGRREPAVDMHRYRLPAAAAVVPVGSHGQALACRNLCRGLAAERTRDRETARGQQAGHAHHGHGRTGGKADVAPLALAACTRGQPEIARLDLPRVEMQLLHLPLAVAGLAGLNQGHIAPGRHRDAGLIADRSHYDRVILDSAVQVCLGITADRAIGGQRQAAADDDRLLALRRRAGMHLLVIDDAGLTAERHVGPRARLHPCQHEIVHTALAEVEQAVGQGRQAAGKIDAQGLLLRANRAGQCFQPDLATGDRRRRGGTAVADVIQGIEADIAPLSLEILRADLAQRQTVHAIEIDLVAGMGAHARLPVVGRQVDQDGRAALRQIRAQQTDVQAGHQSHFAGVAEGFQGSGIHRRQGDIGVMTLTAGGRVDDGLACLQGDIARRHNLTHAQIGFGSIGNARRIGAARAGQHQVQVHRTGLRHTRHPARLDIECVTRGQAQLQVFGRVALVDALTIEGTAHDVAGRRQADLAVTLQTAAIGAKQRTACSLDHHTLGAMNVAHAQVALRRLQADRRLAVGRHDTLLGLNRERARQAESQVARIAHIADQHAILQALRAGAVLRHERHVQLGPDRIQQACADVHHLLARGQCVGDIARQLFAYRSACVLGELAVVDEQVGGVLIQAETVGKQELHRAAGREILAQGQAGIIGEDRFERLPTAGVAEVHLRAIQRDRAVLTDVTIQAVIHARQVGCVGARKHGLLGLGKRVKDIGALFLAEVAQIRQGQDVIAHRGADGSPARGAQRNVAPGLHIQEPFAGHRLRIALDIKHLSIDDRGHRIQQVVLDLAQRGLVEIEEIASLVMLAISQALLRRGCRHIAAFAIVARVKHDICAVEIGSREVQRHGLLHVGIQRAQRGILMRPALIQHGIGQRLGQADVAIAVDNDVIGGIGAHVAHGIAQEDLIAGLQRSTLAGAIVHDVGLCQLESAVTHRCQRGPGGSGPGQAGAPVVVVLRRLGQFLLNGVVIDHLVAHRCDQVLHFGQVADRRQVARVVTLAGQLLVQRLHRRAHDALGVAETHRTRTDGELAQHGPRAEAPHQPGHDAGIGEQPGYQLLAFCRLVQQLHLLIEHGVFLGREQTDGVVVLDQNDVGDIVLDAERLAVGRTQVVQVDAVKALQVAVMRDVALRIGHRHDIQTVQRDAARALHACAAGGGVEQLHADAARGGGPQLGKYLFQGQGGNAGVEGVVRAGGQRDRAAIDGLHVVDHAALAVIERQLQALADRQPVLTRQGQRGRALRRESNTVRRVIDQTDASPDQQLIQAGRAARATAGALVRKRQGFELGLRGVDIAAEHQAALEPGAIGAVLIERLSIFIDHADDLDGPVVEQRQPLARQGQAGAILDQLLDCIGKLQAGRVAHVAGGQVPAQFLADVDIVAIGGLPIDQAFDIAIENDLAVGEHARQADTILLHRAFAQRGRAHAMRQAIAKLGGTAFDAAQAEAQGGRQQGAGTDNRRAAIHHVVAAQGDGVAIEADGQMGPGRIDRGDRVAIRPDQGQARNLTLVIRIANGEDDGLANHPIGRVVHPALIVGHRTHARGQSPAQLVAWQSQGIASLAAFDHLGALGGIAMLQASIQRPGARRDGLPGVGLVVAVDGRNDVHRYVRVVGARTAPGRPCPRHRRAHGCDLLLIDSAQEYVTIGLAQRQGHIARAARRGARQIAHERRFQADEHGIELAAEPGHA